MKKILIILGVVVVLGLGYWLGSPLFLDKEVNEPLPERLSQSEVQTGKGDVNIDLPTELVTVAEGRFVDSDSFHKGEGTAKLIKTGEKYLVRFENDFKVTNGPDLFVYLGKDGKYASEAQLAALKGNIGSQNYEVPEVIDPTKYNEVWIWCRAFSVPFARAVLEEVSR